MWLETAWCCYQRVAEADAKGCVTARSGTFLAKVFLLLRLGICHQFVAEADAKAAAAMSLYNCLKISIGG